MEAHFIVLKKIIFSFNKFNIILLFVLNSVLSDVNKALISLLVVILCLKCVFYLSFINTIQLKF